MMHPPQLTAFVQRLNRLKGPIAAIATVGAILSGLAGYFNVYRLVHESAQISASAGEAAAKAQRPAPWSPDDRRMSFAVLPPNGPAGDPTGLDDADQLADQVVQILSRDSHVGSVLSRDAIDLAKKNSRSLVELGRQLRVAFLVSGTLRRETGRLQATLTLTDVETGAALGAEQFTELPTQDANDRLATLTSTVTRLINRAKKAEIDRVLAKPEAGRDARDLVTLTWSYEWSRSKVAADKKVALAEQAYRLAPDNPKVIVALGLLLASRAENKWSDNEADDEKRAGLLLDRVLLSEPSNIDALSGKILNFMGQERWADALAVGRQIEQITPLDYGNLVDNAISLSMLGSDDKALQLLDQVPPLVADQHNILLQVSYGKALLAMGRVPEAETRFRTAILATSPAEFATWPGNADLLHLVAAEALLNRPDEAQKFLTDYYAANPGSQPLSDRESRITFWEDSPSLRQKVREGLEKAGVTER